MLGIFGILVAIWFYRSAVSSGNSMVWQWVVAGVLIYYLAGIGWTYGIVLPLLKNAHNSHGMGMSLFMEISGIVVAMLVVALVRFILLMKSPGSK